jgi:hypothetical protein
MSKIAESAGVERESVYRMLSETGNPTWLSLRGIVQALAFEWDIRPVRKASKAHFNLDYTWGWANTQVPRGGDMPARDFSIWLMFVGQQIANPSIGRYASVTTGNNSNTYEVVADSSGSIGNLGQPLRGYANQHA